MVSKQINLADQWSNLSLSPLQIALLGWSIILALPFLIFAFKYLDFLLFSSIKDLPRASSKTAAQDTRNNVPVAKELSWLEENNSTVVTWKNDIGMLDLYVADPKALAWILGSNAYRYGRSGVSERISKNILGEGIVTAEGDVHKRQRRALAPSFHPNNLKLLTPIFFKFSKKMLQCLEEDTDLKDKYEAKEGKVVDIEKYLGRTTLDVIGLAGFGYNYQALGSGSSAGSELSQAIASSVKAFRPFSSFQRILTSPSVQSLFPILADHPIVKRNRYIADSRHKTEKVAEEIVALKIQKVKEQMAAEGETKLSKDSDALKGSDVLDFMIRSSLAADTPANAKLHFKELIPQLATFTFAGAETTSTLLGSLMIHLGQRQDYQLRLQKELDDFYAELPEDTDPDWDGINSLPFLSSLISETLRYSPPVPLITRSPLKDDVVPLSRPIIDRKGKKITQIKIRKGTQILLGLGSNNRLKEIWGEDADQFNPDRWQNLPQSHRDAHLPSPYELWSFSGGPKVCIGARFATTEAKCIAATILRKYRVELVAEMTWRQFMVNRVCIKGRENEGPQLPVRLISRATAV